MKSLAQILLNITDKDSGKYLKHEWQLFGYRLCMWLGDPARISYYMKIAKNEDRVLLERAWDFVKESSNAKSRAALFMWKLKELRALKKKAPSQEA
jgi:hypothetical protein